MSAEQMADLFVDIPESIANSVTIAKRCSYMSPERAPILPAFTAGTNLTEDVALAQQAEDGLAQRLDRHVYGDDMDKATKADIAKPYQDRLAFELGVINQM